MIEIACLKEPVPEAGRYLSNSERKRIRTLTGLDYDGGSMVVAATDDGMTAFCPMAHKKDVLFVSRYPAGVYNVLQDAVPREGRYLTQYETVLLRQAGVPCSVQWRVLMIPGTSYALRVGAGDQFAGIRLTVRTAAPEGCCCWACVAECTSRRVAG